MTEIKAFNKYSNEVFKLFFEDGKLVRNYSYHYVTLKTLYDEYRVPEDGQESICVEHFNRAIRNICIQDRDIDFEELLFCLREDQKYFDIANKIISKETQKMSKRIEIMSKALPNVLEGGHKIYLYNPSNYLTPEQIRKMKDEEIVLVNRIAINSQLARLGVKTDDENRKAALEILLKVSHELGSKEAKRHRIYWGARMTVKDIKIAFGKRLDEMSRTYFRKI